MRDCEFLEKLDYFVLVCLFYRPDYLGRTVLQGPVEIFLNREIVVSGMEARASNARQDLYPGLDP